MHWVAGVLFAIAAAHPETFVLNSPVDAWDVTRGDLNGDGLTDVVVYGSDATSENPTKELVLFLGEDGGRFSSEPSLRYKLDPSNGTAFACEFDGEPPEELIEVGQGGANVLRLEDGSLKVIDRVEFNSLLPGRTREPIFARDIPRDLDGDGAEEWLIPTPLGVSVYSRGHLRAEIPAPVSSEFREYGYRTITHRLPAVTSFALPEETNNAIALLGDRYADFSYGHEWTEHVRHPLAIHNEENWDASAEFEDINADGYPDLVVTQTSGTVNLEVLTQIYFAQGPFQYPEQPDSKFETKGSFTTVELADVDGDGKSDLVLVRISLGVRNIINYFLRKRVSIEVAVHYLRNGGFAQRADETTSITIDAPDGREQSAYATGDFDGDGRLDVMVGTGEQRLTFYQGALNAFLSSRPWISLEIPTFGVARIADLNGNDADDIILHHPNGAHKRRVDLILF
jgi:hypothetical protein